MLEKISWIWGGGASSSTTPPATNVKSSEACEIVKPNPKNPQGLKPCCACPETKRTRDECYLKADPSVADDTCREVVRAHIACMRRYGFEV